MIVLLLGCVWLFRVFHVLTSKLLERLSLEEEL
jgi:hypothetical protein